ncbi:MAG: hypothetical protein INR69_23900 [Mucilaginibacter polytrichastri]|nr:hypothetical protein [Mucilaginibacter polytrichastri]
MSIIIHAPFLHVNAMALFPVILIREKEFAHDPVLINHEKIHLRQEIEMLILPFYLCYLGCYVLNRAKGMDHDTAYRQIIFGREAYANEAKLQYLKTRKFWAWRKE